MRLRFIARHLLRDRGALGLFISFPCSERHRDRRPDPAVFARRGVRFAPNGCEHLW
jgi:hypothetical protein